MRINKFLSICGVTSRRGAEKMIEEGRVIVNGIAVDKPGAVIDEAQDVVKVDGTVVEPARRKVYVLLNKPEHVMTTLFDPFRRKTVRQLMKGLPDRVYPIGRLDYDTQGVLLLTNDGELAYRLAHPRYQVTRVYEAKVSGRFTSDDVVQIERGIRLNDGAIGHGQVAILGFSGSGTRIRIVMTEGRKREVKQLCRAVGHPVRHLRRVEFAGIRSDRLRLGAWRHLTDNEVQRVRSLVGL